MNERRYKHLFGPVPSRRLGRSLGVDLVPYKICTYDCIYCQVGKTTTKTVRRAEYVPTEEVLAELRQALAEPDPCDYVTLSGSGEPTLHRDVDRIITAIKAVTDIPVAVLTNGALLYEPEVRRALLPADLVAPSLDAGDAQTFQRINRPCPEISFERMVDGLKAFRREYTGQLRLEVLFCAGINDGDEQVGRIRAIIDEVNPDRIDVNTVTRPPAEAQAQAVPPDRLAHICRPLGPKAHPIVGGPEVSDRAGPITAADVLALLNRRPCTLEDLVAGLRCHRWEAVKLLERLCRAGRVRSRQQDGKTYYLASNRPE